MQPDRDNRCGPRASPGPAGSLYVSRKYKNMIWSFEIKETSNGVYTCEGMRDTGNIVSIQCGENELHKIFKLAYDLEVELGTLPSRALFLVVSGSMPSKRKRRRRG